MAVFQLSGMAGVPQRVAPQRAERREMNVLSGLAGLQSMQQLAKAEQEKRAQLDQSRRLFGMMGQDGVTEAQLLQEAVGADPFAQRYVSGQVQARQQAGGFAELGPIASQMEAVGEEMAMALQRGDRATYDQKAAEYNQLQGQYVAKSGKRYEAQSLERAAGMQKAIADAQKAEAGAKGDQSKIRMDAIKYTDERVDKILSSKRALLDKLQNVRQGAELLKAIQETDAPEQLFAVTKMLAGQIEPGLSVSDGEVRGFLGANQITSVISTVESLQRGLQALGNPESAGSLAYNAASGNAVAVNKLKTFAKQLNLLAVNAYQTMISEGTAEQVKYIKADIESAYGGAIDQQVLQDINSRVSGKLQAAIGTGAPIPTTGSEGTGEKTSTKPKPTTEKPAATGSRTGKRTGTVQM